MVLRFPAVVLALLFGFMTIHCSEPSRGTAIAGGSDGGSDGSPDKSAEGVTSDIPTGQWERANGAESGGEGRLHRLAQGGEVVDAVTHQLGPPSGVEAKA